MEKLLPCPFCGNEEPGVRVREFHNPECARVECIHCGIGTDTSENQSKTEAVRVWNTRTPAGT